ncbi:hypothetical protein ACJX0J_040157, partial [Zea mays]
MVMGKESTSSEQNLSLNSNHQEKLQDVDMFIHTRDIGSCMWFQVCQILYIFLIIFSVGRLKDETEIYTNYYYNKTLGVLGDGVDGVRSEARYIFFGGGGGFMRVFHMLIYRATPKSIVVRLSIPLYGLPREVFFVMPK